MSTYSLSQAQDSLWLARLRRFFRWLTTPYVVLSLVMIVVMFYMVIIPLWRMIVTTVTVSEIDLRDPGCITWRYDLLSLATNADWANREDHDL